MIKLKISSFIVFVVLASASFQSAASQAAKQSQLPRLKAIEHQKMMLGNTVVYEKDVDLFNPDLPSLAVSLSLDGLTKSDVTIADSISVEKTGKVDVHGNLLNGYMISYVVTDITPDGHAKLKLLYTLRNPDEAEDKSGYVSAVIAIGERYAHAEADGTKIAITVRKQD